MVKFVTVLFYQMDIYYLFDRSITLSPPPWATSSQYIVVSVTKRLVKDLVGVSLT